jgi:hypothetical protein
MLAAPEQHPGQHRPVVRLVGPLHRPADPLGRGCHLPGVLVQPGRRLGVHSAQPHELHSLDAWQQRQVVLDDRDLVEHAGQGVARAEQVVGADEGMPLLA